MVLWKIHVKLVGLPDKEWVKCLTIDWLKLIKYSLFVALLLASSLYFSL